MNPEKVAAMDQAAAGLKDVSPAVAAFYRGLRSEGLGRVDAALTASAWLVLQTQAPKDNQ